LLFTIYNNYEYNKTTTMTNQIGCYIDTIEKLRNDIKILELERDNKQLEKDNKHLRVVTLSRDVDIYKEKDRQALEEMGDKMDDESNIQYIHYLEKKESELLKIINEFIYGYNYDRNKTMTDNLR
jgi:regulator of replication initiation timing